jgi:nicotinate-nucleotide adenylyltransferase
LLKKYAFILYPRPGFEVSGLLGNVQLIDAPLLEISSTAVRKNIKEGKSIRYLVPDNVREEIEKSGYYK